MMLTYSSVREVDELTSTQEEVDFGLLLHGQHSLKSESATLIRSHSGDTDIFVMVLFLLFLKSHYLLTLILQHPEKLSA